MVILARLFFRRLNPEVSLKLETWVRELSISSSSKGHYKLNRNLFHSVLLP